MARGLHDQMHHTMHVTLHHVLLYRGSKLAVADTLLQIRSSIDRTQAKDHQGWFHEAHLCRHPTAPGSSCGRHPSPAHHAMWPTLHRVYSCCPMVCAPAETKARLDKGGGGGEGGQLYPNPSVHSPPRTRDSPHNLWEDRSPNEGGAGGGGGDARGPDPSTTTPLSTRGKCSSAPLAQWALEVSAGPPRGGLCEAGILSRERRVGMSSTQSIQGGEKARTDQWT